MDYETTKALDELDQLMNDKREQYKDVEKMKGFVAFLDETRLNVNFRVMTEEVYADWVKAVQCDVRHQEYHHRAENGLLTPEEQEARDKLRAFLLGPCDLPDDVR